MSRFLSFAFLAPVSFGVCLALSGGLSVSACGSTTPETTTASSVDASPLRRDAAPVEPSEGGGPSLDAGITPPPPSCSRYCDLVTANCTGKSAQYASREDCLAFCAHLPLGEATTEDVKSSATVACRQYWADTPAKTDPDTYCLAAGPFGGNTCGDRCTAFCSVLLSACSPDAGKAPYASQPECATACAGFTYRDGGIDGGGEGPYGPDGGDTLNCRLYWLREATEYVGACMNLAPDSDVCK